MIIHRTIRQLLVFLFLVSGSNVLFSQDMKHNAQGSLLAFQNAVVETNNARITKTKSPGKAFWLSALLPGTGEYYAGDKKMGGIFFSFEAALWSVHLSLRTYGQWKKQDYRQFAISHAGINISGKERQYFVDIEDYSNIRAFNDEQLQLRDLERMYPETDFYDWQWDNEGNREKYESIRIDSDRAYDRARIAVLGILLNHLASAIDAMRVARSQNTKVAMNRTRFAFSTLPEGGGMVHLWKWF